MEDEINKIENSLSMLPNQEEENEGMGKVRSFFRGVKNKITQQGGPDHLMWQVDPLIPTECTKICGFSSLILLPHDFLSCFDQRIRERGKINFEWHKIFANNFFLKKKNNKTN